MGNAVWLTLAAMVVGGTRFGTNWWIAREFGAAMHGRFAVVFQLISMVVVFGELGIATTYGVGRIAAARASADRGMQRLVNGLAAALILVHGATLILLLVACLPLAFAFDVPIELLVPASFWLIGFGLYRVAMMVTSGFERTDLALVATLIFYGAWIGWLVTGMRRGVDLTVLVTGWAWILPVAGAAGCAAVTPLMRFRGMRWRVCPGAVVEALTLIARAVPYGLPMAGTFAVPGVACLLLAAVADPVQVSYFQICYSVAIVAYLVAVPFATAALARWSRLHVDDAAPADAAPALLAAGVRLCGGVALAALALHALCGPHVLGWIDTVYADQVTLLLALAAGVALDAVRMLLDQLLLARGVVREVVRLEPVRYAVLLGAGLLLVPAHGAAGAVVAVVLSMAVNTALKARLARRHEKLSVWWFLGVIAGAAVLAVVFGPTWVSAVICGGAAAGLWMAPWRAAPASDP